MKLRAYFMARFYEMRHDYRYTRYTGQGRIVSVSAAIIAQLQNAANTGSCLVFGHQYEASADPENGTEDVWCVRCGDTFTARF